MECIGEGDHDDHNHGAYHQHHQPQQKQHRRDHQPHSDHDEEQKHFAGVCEAYRQYAPFAMAQWTNRMFRLQALPEAQRQLLPQRLLRPEETTGDSGGDSSNTSTREREYKDAVIRNQFCLDCILRHAGQPHSQERLQESSTTGSNTVVSDEQISKVSSVLKSLVRDWSPEGKAERDAAYKPILDLVRKYLPPDSLQKSTGVPTVCVPGSGVGRLALELRAAGYSVQGNDFSLHMLLASDFVLNNGGVCSPERPLQISPWLLEARNRHCYQDELRSVSIPDVDPMQLLNSQQISSEVPPPEFSMAAGDFCGIYNHQDQANQWDCVASCFFLDACPNIIETLQVIYHMLKPGGFLINLGPLLYHWSGPMLRPDDGTWQRYRERHSRLDDRYLTSIDLSFDDVKQIMINIGFEVLEENCGIECYYTADWHSMMRTRYQCVSFVARKKR